jgi:hypothetical protein
MIRQTNFKKSTKALTISEKDPLLAESKAVKLAAYFSIITIIIITITIITIIKSATTF